MGNFRILEHTADAGFEVKAASLSDLFETGARAMLSLEYDLSRVAFEREVTIEAQGTDLEDLLAAWLSEVLYVHDAHGFVPGDFIVVEVGESQRIAVGKPPFSVRGTARGRMIGEWFEQTGPQIKAVTLHGLEVREKRGNWEAVVYLDV